MFDLTIVNYEHGIFGEITIGDFFEEFWMSNDFWNSDQYIEYWKRALTHFFNNKEKPIALIADYNGDSAFSTCWIIYQEKEVVYVQSHMLKINGQFDSENKFFIDKIANLIDPIEFVGEDGNKISTWETTYTELETFLNRLESMGAD